MRIWLAVFVLLVLVPVSAAVADEADPNLEFFDPLVIGRPVIERELELKVAHTKGRAGRETSLVAAGFELRLPTGSERRGLGGEAAVEIFLRGAVALGPFDVLGQVAYEWNINAHATVSASRS